jgi:hypothetical protein
MLYTFGSQIEARGVKMILLRPWLSGISLPLLAIVLLKILLVKVNLQMALKDPRSSDAFLSTL